MPMDHLTFCTLSTLDKLLNDDVIRNPNYSDQLMEIWSKQVPIFAGFVCMQMVVLAQVQQLLSHAHMWVQLTACKLFGRLFNTYKITTKAITEAHSFLSVEPAKKVCHVKCL